jgi:nicotinamide mononucleotide (NMN) deamidase PncC
VTWGLPAEELTRRLDQVSLPDAGVHVEVLVDGRWSARILLSAPDRDRLDWCAALARASLGDVVLGTEGCDLAGTVVDLLRRQGLRVATAEWGTDGRVATALCEAAGGLDAVHSGSVCDRSPDARRALGLTDAPLGPTAAAVAMARGVARLTGADVGLAVRVARPHAGAPAAGVGAHVASWLGGESRTTPLALGPADERPEVVADHALDHLRHRLLARERLRTTWR